MPLFEGRGLDARRRDHGKVIMDGYTDHGLLVDYSKKISAFQFSGEEFYRYDW